MTGIKRIESSVRVWFLQAVLFGALMVTIATESIYAGSSFLVVGNMTLYFCVLLFIIACFKLKSLVKEDSREFATFALMETAPTDLLVLGILLIDALSLLVLVWATDTYSRWIMSGLYTMLYYDIFLLVMTIPVLFMILSGYVILIRRLKNSEQVSTSAIKNRINAMRENAAGRLQEAGGKLPGSGGFKGFLKKILDYIRKLIRGMYYRFKKSRAFEKKQYVKSVVFICFNVFNIACLFLYITGFLSGLPVFWMLLLLVLQIIFYVREDDFYHDVMKLTEDIDKISEGEIPETLPVEEESELYEAALSLQKIGESYKINLNREVRDEREKAGVIAKYSDDLKTPAKEIEDELKQLLEEGHEITSEEKESLLKKVSDFRERIENLRDLSASASMEEEVALEAVDLAAMTRAYIEDLTETDPGRMSSVRQNLPEEQVMIRSNKDRLIRVIDQLMNNALNYALTGSRIYVDLKEEEGMVKWTIRNTASYEMLFDGGEIFEICAQGDSERLQGSGMGLTLAKSMTTVCGGQLQILIEGDVFKAVLQYAKWDAAAEIV